MDVHERQLLEVICAYRLFMPFAGITVSSRECARVRDNLMQIAATKISAGVSTGIGEHGEEVRIKGMSSSRFPTTGLWRKSMELCGNITCSPLWRTPFMCRRQPMCRKTERENWEHVIAVTNRKLTARPYMEQIERICLKRPEAVLVREKDLSEEEYGRLASEVYAICKKYEVPCIYHTFVQAARKQGRQQSIFRCLF